MSRLFTIRGVYELLRCSSSVLTRLPASSASHPRAFTPARHFSTGSPRGRETIDLDKWKSVMRSQAASAEKQADVKEDGDSDDDENPREPGDGSKDDSTLEAVRELVEMWRQAGKFVPKEMTEEEVEELAKLTTKSSKRKYLKFLAIKEGHKNTRKAKQQKKRAAREALLEQTTEQDGGDESDKKNSFLMKFWDRSLDQLLGWRNAQAMLFGQPLIFDMSYESVMSRRELVNTVSQLIGLEGLNWRATDPFHLHFCNLQPDGFYKSELVKRYGANAWERLLVTVTHSQHVEVFPRERLVYLTADSPNVLRSFDHSKVYIIGGLVDRSINSGLSLANAKRLKLATARLPLDEFLHWEAGAKNLTLDQMFCIMLTLKDTGKWEEALKFVPKRKHDGFYQQRSQKGITSHGPREHGGTLLRPRELNGEGQSLHKSHKDSGFTGGDRVSGSPGRKENKPPTTRVRTSFKSVMEGRSVGRSKTWWRDE